MQKLPAILLFTFYLLPLAGCATTPLIIPPKPPGIPGIYHRVERGQTLWIISKIYNTDINELVKINHISEATSIEVGQLIFIPYQQNQITPYNKSSFLIEDFIWPVKGEVLNNFGHVYNDMLNKGINIKPYRRNDNIVAARSGKVVFYNSALKGFGQTLIIDHGDGFSTVYAGVSQVFVKIGDNLHKGDLIAKAGLNLHFQIRKGYVPQNPYFYLPQK